MDVDDGAADGCPFPEGIECGIVEYTAITMGLGSDHHAFQAGVQGLVEHCGRQFMRDRIEKHAKVCEKVFIKKRKVCVLSS